MTKFDPHPPLFQPRVEKNFDPLTYSLDPPPTKNFDPPTSSLQPPPTKNFAPPTSSLDPPTYKKSRPPHLHFDNSITGLTSSKNVSACLRTCFSSFRSRKLRFSTSRFEFTSFISPSSLSNIAYKYELNV